MDEGEKRAADNAFHNYMNNLNDQWDAACVVFKTRIHNMQQEFVNLEVEVRNLKNSLKNYKKTFTMCESYAKQATNRMEKTRGELFRILGEFDPNDLNKVVRILELIKQDDY